MLVPPYLPWRVGFNILVPPLVPLVPLVPPLVLLPPPPPLLVGFMVWLALPPLLLPLPLPVAEQMAILTATTITNASRPHCLMVLQG